MITWWLVAAVVSFAAIWRPRWGLAALIIAWPSYLLRLELANIPTTALELSLYAVTIVVIVNLLFKKISWPSQKWPPMMWWLLFGWAAAWISATFFAADRTAALGALKAWWFDPLLFGGLLYVLIRHEVDRRLAVQAAVISGVFVALAGLGQMVWWPDTLQEGRLSSWFAPVANYAAMFLGPLVVLTLALLLYRYLRGWSWWLGLTIMGLALALTMSFGTYLAVAIAAVVIWVFLPAGKLKKWLLISGAIVVMSGVLGLTQTKNFSQHFDFAGRSSGAVRQQIWVTSWALVGQHPWFGIGPNNFETAYRVELPKHYFPPLEWLVSQPHNLYLALWLETGLLGLITLVVFCGLWFRASIKKIRANDDSRAIAVAAVAAMVAILVHGLMDTTYFKNDLSMEFVFIAVIPWLAKKNESTISITA